MYHSCNIDREATRRMNTREDIKFACGKASKSLLLCPFDNCGCRLTNFATEYEIDTIESWKVCLECGICNKRWYVCHECDGRTVAFTTKLMVSRHRYTYHPMKTPKKTTKTPKKTPLKKKRKAMTTTGMVQQK